MCVDIYNFLNFLSKRDSILIILLVLVNVLTLSMYSKTPIKLFVVNLVLLIGYFIITDRENKLVLLLAALNFAFWGVILEAFIIRNTHFAIRYKMSMSVLDVPVWLFTTYMVFIIVAVFTYESFMVLLNR
jgi:hypothetical protein